MCVCAHACTLSRYFALDKYRHISGAYVTVTPEVKEIIKISDSVIKVDQNISRTPYYNDCAFDPNT